MESIKLTYTRKTYYTKVILYTKLAN